MMTRTLGTAGPSVSALGVGCWAIGGPWQMGGIEAGWGAVDDDESVRALQAALEAGVTFFDTAANYGAGHSERVLGRAIAARRDDVVLATKFGYRVDEANRTVGGPDTTPASIAAQCRESLRRLGTDRIDVYWFHVGDHPIEAVDDVLGALDQLVEEGLIRSYGWSTDDVPRAEAFLAGAHCVAVQHQLNVFQDNPAMLELCEHWGVASVNRGPLAMGLLTGSYGPDRQFAAGDLRRQNLEWMGYFTDGRPSPAWLARLDAVRDVLTAGGRTLAQGALGWLWARSPMTIPIPGVRTVAQAQSNAAALQFGPLTAAQLAEIETLVAAQPL
ncbi:MAG: aldo/keto reductase [Kineosporiaceae bacterium]|nr:aldo/keto reductase [Kineosporiaceae bacterium]